MPKQYRILALDNHPEHAKLFKKACEEGGHELVLRSSVAEAIEWVSTRDRVDVIVTCAHLKDRLGVFEFLRAVKQNPQLNWIQFIIICPNPSDIALQMNNYVQHLADLLGADKYLLLSEFDPHRILREITASIPEQPPQQILHPESDTEMRDHPI